MSSRTKGLWVGAVVAIATAVALLRGGARAPTAAGPARGSDAANETAAAVETTEVGTAADREARDPGAAAPTAETEATATADADAALELREVRGTMRFFDPYGAHRPVLEGSFRIACYADDATPHTISVSQGAWAIAIPGEVIDFLDCVADGGPAFLHGAMDHIALPKKGPLELLVTRDTGCRLVVVDALNGRELDDLDIYRQTAHTRWGSRSPAASEPRVAEHAASPFAVDLHGDDEETFYVRSPGYAWNITRVRIAACGDRVVALEPGGDLRVLVGGFAPPDGAEVRLRRVRVTDDPYDEQYVEHALAIDSSNRTVDFESIESGAYEVSVELGESTWRPARLGAAKCEVRTRERTVLELTLPSPEPAVLVHAAGTIRAEGWPRVGVLELHAVRAPHVGGKYEYRAQPSRAEEPEASLYKWSLDAIEPGDYEVFVGGPSWYGDLTIGPADSDQYELAVPAPARAHVRVTDADRGGLAEVPQVLWLGYAGPWRAGGQSNEAEFDEASSRWNFVAPVGSVSILADSVAHAHRLQPVTLHAGDNDIDLAISRTCGIIAVFVCRGEVVSRDLAWDLALETSEGKRVGFANPLDAHETELILKAPGPGRYRLDARGLGAYRVRGTVEVEVAPDSFTHTVVELERAP